MQGMKRTRIAICAVVAAIVIATLVDRNCPESWEPIVYWALPMLHLFMLPLDSGPNPFAAFCCLLINAAILSITMYFAIRAVVCAVTKHRPSN